MNNEELIATLGHAACACLAAVLFAWSERCEKVVEYTAGKTILRYVWPYRIMGVLLVVLVLVVEVVLTVVPIAKPPDEPWVSWAAAGFLVVFPLGALYVGLDSLKSYAIVSDVGIEKYSPWWGQMVLDWEGIASAEMFPSGAVVIRGWTKKRLSFPNYWKGRTFLIEELTRRGVPCQVQATMTPSA